MPRVPPLAPTGAEPELGDTVVLPRGGILSRNPLEANLINEEEITRDGLLLRRTFQMTRWSGGARVAWSGLTRRNGRGEGASGLFFDQVRPKSK
jgi:hypothetical protein